MGDSRYPQEHRPSYELRERGPSNDHASSEAQLDSKSHLPLDVTSIDLMRRRLKQRHIQMYIAGTIGTGLFLGSGEAINTAGPLGALITFALVGSVAYASLCSLGEMTSLAPVSGTFPYFASRWVDPALGFAVGWIYFLTNALSVLAEISGARVLITAWDTGHALAYTLVICIVMCATNIFGVVYFAETEFAFSTMKLIMIIALIIVGLLIDLGGLPNDQLSIGFLYWKDPGPLVAPSLGLEPEHPSLNNFIGILSVIVQAAFAYQGMEIVAVAASETKNPRRNIAKAVRRVFYRILVFYILGIFVAGLIVPSNDPGLLTSNSVGAGTAAQSPFVIAIRRAKIKALPGIVTAGMLTSAFSAGNSFLFCSSRILYGLAIRGQAPHFLTFCTKKGLPIAAVLCSSAFAFLSLLGVLSGAGIAFNWFLQLATVGGYVGWFSINVTYLFFYRGLRAQKIDRRGLYYWNTLQPWLSIWGLFWSIIFILINGFTVFWHFKVSGFMTSYVVVPVFLLLIVFWKYTRQTEIWKPDEMDFTTGIPSFEETEGPEILPRGFWQHVAAALF
ncbi:general amino acid permease 1 [Rhizopogon salebrosus TDB-379]|nr:general amino acid permease 1 [Rhizopogon salebrosus TDB-379]